MIPKSTLQQVVNDPNAMPADIRDAARRLLVPLPEGIERRYTPHATALKDARHEDEVIVAWFLEREARGE